MAAPIPSPLDGNQVLQHSFNDATGQIRVQADFNGQVVPITVELDAVNDSVRIEDPDTGAHVRVEADGSINANIIGDIQIEIDAADGDNIAISDGTNTLDINTDGSIKTVQIFTLPFDSITATYPSATQEVYQSRIGGVSGTVQQTVTINYVDSTKNLILNLARV